MNPKYDIVDVLNEPWKFYPANFETAMRANAFYSGLCQEAAEEIKKLRNSPESVTNSNYSTSGIPAIKVQDLGKI